MSSPRLYHTLANIAPTHHSLRNPTDYICDKQGSMFLSSTLKPGDYKGYCVIGYAKLTQQDDVDDISERHPHLKEWVEKLWPRPVGRYAVTKYQVVDVVFAVVSDPHWTKKEQDEWTRGTYGYYSEWIYDLRSAPLAAVVMGYINEIPSSERTKVRVVRHILAAADVCNRQDALLHGQWVGSFKDGTHPTAWKQVMDIYTQRYKTGKAVKYAQCWVYAEVLTCAFRFLGIPARTVYATNAHIDRHRDGGIDLGLVLSKGEGPVTTERVKIDVTSLLSAPTGAIKPVVLSRTSSPPSSVGNSSAESARAGPPTSPISPKGLLIRPTSPSEATKGNVTSPKAIPVRPALPLPDEDVDVKTLVGSDDGVWNFHVWNEVYMDRPDLKAPYSSSAWQCLDASPILATDTADDYKGKHIFGPCSTLSLRSGVDLPHDFRYLYSAVNSVYRYWRCSQDVYYVTHISYSQWDRKAAAIGAGVLSEPTVVVTRNPEKSHCTSVVDLDITASYTPTTPHQAYEIHHIHHPIIFIVKGGRLCAIIKQDGHYYVQFCCLNVEGSLLHCYRQQVTTLKNLSAPSITATCSYISTLVVNITTQQWWVQVISTK